MKLSDFIVPARGKCIVCDVDDVLLYTTPLWYKILNDRKHLIKDFIKPNVFLDGYNYEDHFGYPLSRDEYYFDKWLLRDDISKDDREKCKEIILNCIDEEGFYRNPLLKVTNLAKTLNDMISFKNNFGIEKVYFVTKTTPKDPNRDDKITIIKNLFSNHINKIEIVFVKAHEKKSEFIDSITYEIASIFDDHLENMRDILMNCNNISNTILMVPQFGWNDKFDESLLKMSQEKNAPLKLYNL